MANYLTPTGGYNGTPPLRTGIDLTRGMAAGVNARNALLQGDVLRGEYDMKVADRDRRVANEATDRANQEVDRARLHQFQDKEDFRAQAAHEMDMLLKEADLTPAGKEVTFTYDNGITIKGGKDIVAKFAARMRQEPDLLLDSDEIAAFIAAGGSIEMPNKYKNLVYTDEGYVTAENAINKKRPGETTPAAEKQARIDVLKKEKKRLEKERRDWRARADLFMENPGVQMVIHELDDKIADVGRRLRALGVTDAGADDPLGIKNLLKEPAE